MPSLPFVATAQIDVSRSADWTDSFQLLMPAIIVVPSTFFLDETDLGLASDPVGPSIDLGPAYAPVGVVATTLSLTYLDPVSNGPVSTPAIPLDMTDADLEMTVAPAYGDSRVIARYGTKVLKNILALDQVNAVYAFAVPQSQMALLPEGSWKFVMRRNLSGQLVDVMRGLFNVHARSPF